MKKPKNNYLSKLLHIGLQEIYFGQTMSITGVVRANTVELLGVLRYEFPNFHMHASSILKEF